MFGNIKFILVTIAVIAAIAGYSFVTISGLKNEKLKLLTNLSVIESALTESRESFLALKKEHENVRKVYAETVEAFKAIDANSEAAIKKIEDVDFNDITNSTDAINKMFKEATRCMEIASGSPLTKEELSETNAEDFNSQCPWRHPAYSLLKHEPTKN